MQTFCIWILAGSEAVPPVVAEEIDRLVYMKCVHWRLLVPFPIWSQRKFAAQFLMDLRVHEFGHGNVDAVHTDPDEIRGLLYRQVCGVVEWHASMEFLLSTGAENLWKLGGSSLTRPPQRINRKIPCKGVMTVKCVQTFCLTNSNCEHDVNWKTDSKYWNGVIVWLKRCRQSQYRLTCLAKWLL